MKRVLFIIVTVLAISCTMSDIDLQSVALDSLTPEEAQMEFAEILSKALSQNQDLREFIKSESLRQFDMDYDVFYPYIKDLVVRESKSFRDILLQYTTEEIITDIEEKLPLLTIYVPDYSWIGAFYPEKWDVTDDEIVVAVKHNDDLKILYDGEVVGILGENQYADFPLVIIKNNERLVVNDCATKSGECQYRFISDAFDSRLNQVKPKAADWTYSYETIYNIPDPDNYVTASELDSQVIDAFEEYGTTVGRYHRDYIYYGITNENPSGIHNNNYKEYLYKIKFSRSTNGALYDTASGSYIDGNFPDKYENKGKNNKYTADELRDLDFRIEGNLELHIIATLGTKDGTVIEEEDIYTVAMNELFDFDKVYIGERETTMFLWRNKYTYTINKYCLVPKWYTLNKPLSLGMSDYWNLSQTTPYIKIKAMEWDPGETITESSSFTISMSTNTTSETSSGSTKNGYGTTMGLSQTYTYSQSYVNNSDLLGEDYVSFTDSIILAKENGKYKINVHTFGDLEIMILPKHI